MHLSVHFKSVKATLNMNFFTYWFRVFDSNKNELPFFVEVQNDFQLLKNVNMLKLIEQNLKQKLINTYFFQNIFESYGNAENS